MRLIRLGSTVALTATLAACGSGATDTVAPPAAAAGASADGTLQCDGAPVRMQAMETAPTATSLPAPAQQALRDSNIAGITDLENYRVLRHTDQYIDVAKSLSPADPEATGRPGSRPNFRQVTIMSSESGGFGSHGWWYVSDSRCELRRTFKGLSAADVWLDPAFPAPATGDTVVHLLVGELACAGGDPPGKRIKTAELVRTAAEVRIAIGIEPRSGAFTCPGIPPEPYAVELDTPLGDEQVVDSAAYPARPFAPPPSTPGD